MKTQSMAGVLVFLAACSSSTERTEPTPIPGVSDPSAQPSATSTADPALGYLPCARKTTGDRCTVCAPHASGCVETDVIKTCTAKGTCEPASAPSATSTATPSATPTESPVATAAPSAPATTPSPTAPRGATQGYNACEGQTCGAPCTLCRPGDHGCVETAVMKGCSANGACVPKPVECLDLPFSSDPCAFLALNGFAGMDLGPYWTERCPDLAKAGAGGASP